LSDIRSTLPNAEGGADLRVADDRGGLGRDGDATVEAD
jgi:hypothetical protein